MEKREFVVIAIVCILGAALFMYLVYPAVSGSYLQPSRDTVSIGLMPDEAAALVFIAQDKGFFAREGLNLTPWVYPNGATAVRGMENGDVNLTLSSEFPLVAEILRGRDILIAGSIDKYYSTTLVARRDHGITSPSDLSGKTIAISKGSVGEFYLGRFLNLQGIPQENVTLVDRPPGIIVSDLAANGSIDAAVPTPLETYRLMNQPGNPYVAIPILSGQATFKVVAGNRGWITNHPREMAEFLRALRDASQYAAQNPQDAQSIVVTHINVSAGYIQSVWPEHQYHLSLDQSLLLAMEGEAQWMIQDNLTTAGSVPDFLNSLYPGAMQSADPGAVTIVGQGGSA